MAASPKEKFEAAVKVIQTLPKNGLLKLAGSFQPSHDLMLKFYAYYKQATIGPCDIPRPAFWDVIGKAKWNAWNELGDMSKDQAMINYVDSLKKAFEGVTYEQIVEAMPHTDMVQGFVEKLGNFYELVDSADAGKLPTVNGDAFPKIPIDSLRSVAKGVTKQMEEKKRAEEQGETSDITREDKEEEKDEEVSAILDSATPPSPVHSDSSPIDTDSQPEEHTPKKVNGIHSNGHFITVPVNGKAQLNGNGYHSDDEDDDEEDEFCDTSDLPQEIASEYVIEETCVKRPFDPMYVPPSPPRMSPIVFQRNASDVMLTRDQSSAALLVSPGQMGDRHYSAVSLRDEYTGVDVLTARGGGGEQDPVGRPPPGGRRGSGGNGQSSGRGGLGERSGQSAPYGRSQLMAGAGGGGQQGGGGAGGGGSGQRNDVTEQIAVALVRLQQDMSSVLTRLHTLETLTLAHQQIHRSRQNSEGSSHHHNQVSSSPWWWPFPSLRGRTLFFVLVWPFIVHLIIRIISNRRRIGVAMAMVASVALAKRHRRS